VDETGDEISAAPTGRWDRSEVLKRAALGGLGLLLARGERIPLLAAEPASAASAPVRAYFSRPDLKPPVVTVRRSGGTADGHLFLASSSGPGQRGAMILDDAGEVVWFRPSSPDTTMDFRTGLYKGKPVLTWWEGKHEKGVGLRGAYVIMDASYREVARFKSRDQLRPDFHEYLLTPDDTALVVGYDPVHADLTAVGGPGRGLVYEGVVRELAIPSGRVLFEWRSLDHVALAESYQKRGGGPFDYLHVNSIAFDSDGHLIVSARHTWTIYKVHRRTGEVLWRLGGKRSDFRIGKGAAFAFQHDARSHDHGRLISLFDNGPDPGTTPRSRALVLALDTARRRATLQREIVHSPPLFARVTGNQQFLPNGNTVVCWGSTGYFTEYGPDRSVRLDAHLPEGGQNYRVFRFPWVGRPADSPRLVAHTASGTPRLYASWNGATEVAYWQLRGGPAAARLGSGRVFPRRGFETELPVPSAARFVAVAALDHHRKLLGTSNTVRL
jgi:hypothetical protein